jgi:hypothetical protein
MTIVRLHQHKTLGKIQQRAREGDTMSATELLGETKTPDDQLETATARDAREDSVESTEGDATSATKELGETKTPDYRV